MPLFTTAKSYPWYTTRTPLSLQLPAPQSNKTYRYRYAIHRAGIFHRWEEPSDGGGIEKIRAHQTVESGGNSDVHTLPLRLLHGGELYTVNDVLGVTVGPPDIDHIKVRKNYSSVGSLARKNSASGTSLYGLHSRNNSNVRMADQGSKKKVGFAPQPPATSHRSSEAGAIKQAVHLTSSDGLIVVSAFLPVHLTRSENGEWSADWDYEALLSMQTHLRVTRVGTVKWRGWHGNVGGGKSDESGVPIEERHKVEAVLRPFNCVPVWVPTTLFGEM